MTDKSTIQQVLGCLMRHPQFLSEVDKYFLEIADFTNRFERYIYTAIKGLYQNSATHIESIDIENFLQSDPIGITTFQQNNGIEYLNDAIEFSSEENFDYYYNRLKKFNLLRDFKKYGFDISDFYEEDLTKPNAEKINANFEALTTKDICDAMRKKLLHLESAYVRTGEIEIENAADGIADFVKELNETLEVGLPVQGYIYNKILSGAQPGTLTIRSGSSGLGKAIPNYTIIPTPHGMRRVDEIKIGDELWGDDGKPTKVVAIYPQPEPKEIYRVTFKDGRIAECCKEHLWEVYNTKGTRTVMTAEELLNKGLRKPSGGYKYSVPLNDAIQYDEKILYPSPYAMGALLGDRSFRYQSNQKALTISGEDEEIIQRTAKGLNCDYQKNSSQNYTWTFKLMNPVKGRKNLWVEEGLANYPDLWNVKSEAKFIPNEYMTSSVEQRMELLRGLLDTDGSIDIKGRIMYFSNSKIMAEQVVQLCRSLGFIATIAEDKHKTTSIVYIVYIQCDKFKKRELFNITRKKNRAIENETRTERTERRDNNAIINIEPTGKYTEMTCFTVDNDSHLFLMNDYIVTHNTRQAVGDACYLAYPIRYNSFTKEWEQRGSSEKVLFIVTEQTLAQIKKMILAYLTDINESRFKFGDFNKEEQTVINTAIKIMQDYEHNMVLVKMPNPTIESIKTIIRENCLTKDIGYVFYDYIFIGPALLNEFRDCHLRNDELLLMVADALKNLAVELNVALMTSTQVNAQADDNKNIRNEASLAGGRSTINKADNGAIMSRPTQEELETLQPITTKYGVPNMVTDIFKVRSGEWTQVRIWSKVNLGTLKKEDLFVTDARLEAIPEFFQEDQAYEIHNWDTSELNQLTQYVDKLNGKE